MSPQTQNRRKIIKNDKPKNRCKQSRIQAYVAEKNENANQQNYFFPPKKSFENAIANGTSRWTELRN